MDIRERYTTRESWARYGELAVELTETCELGTRVTIIRIDRLIQRAANWHVHRQGTESPEWGYHQPRFEYHGKS